MVMKKFRGRRLRKTAMAVRAEGPRSWRQKGHEPKLSPLRDLVSTGLRLRS